MSFLAARRKRNALYYSIAGLVLMAAAVMSISARDTSGVGLRAGMVMLSTGAAFLLPWQLVIPATLVIWLGPNYVRSLDGDALFGANMLLELPSLLGLSAFSLAVRNSVHRLEEEHLAIGAAGEGAIDPSTGVYEERALRPALQAELSRSHRFNRPFALVLVGIDEKHQRFGYRDDEEWQTSHRATAALLRRTRNHIDRVYLHGQNGFALILPESGEREVTGLVRRLRKIATNTKPREGQPGGPLPVAFGATFFPACAATVDDLMRRAEIALRIGLRNSNRLQLDGAEAPMMAPPETMRQPQALHEAEPSYSPTSVPENISDAWVAEPVQRRAPPVALTLVPTEDLVTAVRQETGDVPGAEPAPSETTQPQAASVMKLAAVPVEAPSELNDEELTQLLGRLDETLGLIRELRAQAS